MPEITTITSESLQAEVRRLLPSQRGFGGDLEAQNVIVPVVDLTPTAEGSFLREDLQTAASFGGISEVSQAGTGSQTVVNTPGFYRYAVTLALLTTVTAGNHQSRLELFDAGSDKDLHRLNNSADATNQEPAVTTFTGTVFLNPNEGLKITCFGLDTFAHCAAWQVADYTGNLVNPNGFSFE